MKIDYSRVLLTTVCLSAVGILRADLGFNGNGKLTIGGGDGKGGGLAASLSGDMEGNGNDLAARAHLNLSASVDMEMPDFSNLTSKNRQNLKKKMNQTDTVSAMFVDEMAEIRVYRDDGVHPISHWAIHRLLGAREFNTTGNETLALFDKNGASWSVATAGMYNGMNCTIREIDAAFTFVANASVKVPINVTAYIFNNDYTLTFKGVNITASFQSVKFTYSIGAWPFQSESKGLTMLALVKTTGMGTKSGADNAPIVAGEVSLIIPTAAMADSANVNVSVNVQYVAFSGSDRAAMLIEWDFPVYMNSLVYDPVMGMADTTSDNATSSAPPASDSSKVTNSSSDNSTTAAVKGGVSSLAVSVLSTVLLLALAMNAA